MKETVVKMNKTKSWFTEMINKIDNQLVSSRKKKGRRIKSTKLEMQKRKEQTMKIYKRSQETITSNDMPIRWTTWKKWMDS